MIPELQSPPNPDIPGPSTSIPPLFAARDSQPRHGPEEPIAGPYGPELPRPKLIPSKAKSKVKIGAGLQSVACFFRPANGSRSEGHGKGHGNAARAAEGLATKSTESVSTSKARALAHRAAVDSKVIPAKP